MVLALLALRGAGAQIPGSNPPAIPREMRAIWVATVDNMDWPSRAGLSTADQKRELIAILDRAVELRMNAIILQVRPEADALYKSSIEPWSEYLTGTMGKAPQPFYDPLEFAVAESHKRGLELHAWINPYRARFSLTRKASPSHVSRANPSWVRKYGPYVWMDPGDPAVRARTEKVVLDIVRRYDIDALHMDDYFYPYKELHRGKEIDFPDASTYKRYKKGGGTLSRDDWRRHNVNLLVEELNTGIHKEKAWVRFGVSPFGIWRPGYPESVRGLDQYTELYADARKWLREGWVDYFTPQLYWSVDKPQQRYDLLLAWWAEQNVFQRHLWPGNYTGKVAFTNSSAWRSSEIIEQIRLTRAQSGASGNVHFSAKVFLQDPDSLNATLRRAVYNTQALVPATPWLSASPREVDAAPVVTFDLDAAGNRTVRMKPVGAKAESPWLWVVQSKVDAAWNTDVLPGGSRAFEFPARMGVAPTDIRVRMVDRLGRVGAESRVVPR